MSFVPYFLILNKIYSQPYLILAFSMKQITSHALCWSFQWQKSKPYLTSAFSMRKIPCCTLFQIFQWSKSSAVHYIGKSADVPYFSFFNEINSQPYLISAVSIKYIPCSTFSCAILWNKSPEAQCFAVYNDVNPQLLLILAYRLIKFPGIPYFSVFNRKSQVAN